MYCNIQVSLDGNPANDRSESELAINPLNPSNMVGASKKFINPATYDFTLAAYYTFDHGTSWAEASPLTLSPGWAGISDPALAWDNAGNVYLAALPFPPGLDQQIGIAVYKSSDGGRSWSPPNLIHSSGGDDKQWAAGDNNPGSPYYGNVYIAWDNGSQLGFARSIDQGQTWIGVGGQPAGTALAFDSFSPDVSVAGDGTVYIGWVSGSQIKFVKSTDGGGSFTAPSIAASGITPLQSPPLPSAGGFPQLPGGLFRVLTLPSGVTGSGQTILFSWSDYRENVSRIYYCYSQDGGNTWLSPASGQALVFDSGADQHDFHPQLATMPDGRIGCAFYEFGPKWQGGPLLIDVVLVISTDNAASFGQRQNVTTRSWDPALDAPFSHGNPSVTFIGDYFGFAADASGFFPFWTDTRTGMQEIFFGCELRTGPWVGLQFSDTLGPNQTISYFTFNWPACWQVVWLPMPTSPAPGAPEITWQVQVERASAYFITYWVNVTNLTAAPVTFEGRYAVLAAN